MLTLEEVKEATKLDVLFLKPKDFTRGADHQYDFNELLADRWRVVLATEEGFIFIRSHIPLNTEAERKERLAAIKKLDEEQTKAYQDAICGTAVSFKVGDVVRLKSGGPQMTVDSLKDKRVLCVWYAGQEVSCRTFVLDTLIAA